MKGGCYESLTDAGTALRITSMMLVALILVSGSPRQSAAQFVINQAGEGASVLPRDTLVLTQRAPTATVTVINPRDTISVFTIDPDCPAGEYAMFGDFYLPTLYDAGRPPLDPLTAAWHKAGSCAAAWITGYPRYLRLAPHERRTFTVRIVPPKTLAPGRYVARLIWTTYSNHRELDITYLRGGPWPAARWRPSPPHGPGSGVVEAKPAVLVLTDTTHTAAFTLRNRAARSIEVWLTIDCPWFMTDFAVYPLSSQYEQEWHERIPGLPLWLGNLPQHLVLAPHEQRTLPLKIVTSAYGQPLHDDKYARVVYVETPVVLGTPRGDTTYTTPAGAIDVVYRAHPPVLTLSRPWIQPFRQSIFGSPPPDTIRRVCDTLRQPGGLGFVATLHAEIQDAQGRPVPVRPGHTGEHVTAWQLDTTVVIWNVTHHNVLDIHTAGQSVDPDPICILVPTASATGPSGADHQLVLTGSIFEDRAHRQPVRVMMPWQ